MNGHLQVLWFDDGRQRQLSKLSPLHLFNDDPVGPDGDGRLPLLDLDLPVVVLATALLLLPFSNLTLTLPGGKRKKLNQLIPQLYKFS